MRSIPDGIKVLITDDDPSACIALELVLTRKYPEVSFYFATDGKDGLNYFREHLPDIVITDVIMPGMDGCSLAREISGIKPDTKLIMLTGLSSMSDFFESIMKGLTIEHRISKPVSLERLFAALEQCMAELPPGQG